MFAYSVRYSLTSLSYRPTLFKTTFFRRFLPTLSEIGTPAFRRKVVEIIPSKLVQEYVEVVDTLESGSKTIYEKSKKALEVGDESIHERIGKGKDILSVLRECSADTSRRECRY